MDNPNNEKKTFCTILKENCEKKSWKDLHYSKKYEFIPTTEAPRKLPSYLNGNYLLIEEYFIWSNTWKLTFF